MYFGPPKTFARHALGLSERELGDRVTDPSLDALRAQRDLVVARALAPLRRAVRVAHGHPHDGDRRVHASERHDAGNATARSHDHLAADLLAENPVRRADVAGPLRRHGGGLQAETVFANRLRCLVDDAVLRSAPSREREVEADEAELDADHVRREHAHRLLEKLLSGLVSFENDDGLHARDPTQPLLAKCVERFALALCEAVSYPCVFHRPKPKEK